MVGTDLPAGPPLGFPRCQQCPYVWAGPPRICVQCASQTLEDIAQRSCGVCSQKLRDDGSCPNWLCTDPRRRISRIYAIAYLSGSLRNKIHRYKYEGAYGWSLIFGRLLLGWLEKCPGGLPDLIVANPTYVVAGQGGLAHTERVLVYDDVCTTGSQLDAVAACLLDEGHAAHVEAITLARALWTGR
jgi:predicted amidophosphoribosyltransferase